MCLCMLVCVGVGRYRGCSLCAFMHTFTTFSVIYFCSSARKLLNAQSDHNGQAGLLRMVLINQARVLWYGVSIKIRLNIVPCVYGSVTNSFPLESRRGLHVLLIPQGVPEIILLNRPYKGKHLQRFIFFNNISAWKL